MQAYILTRVEGGKERVIREQMQKSPAVKEMSFVHGEYDLVLKIETQDLESLDKFLFDELRQANGIKETTTLIVAYV